MESVHILYLKYVGDSLGKDNTCTYKLTRDDHQHNICIISQKFDVGMSRSTHVEYHNHNYTSRPAKVTLILYC